MHLQKQFHQILACLLAYPNPVRINRHENRPLSAFFQTAVFLDIGSTAVVVACEGRLGEMHDIDAQLLFVLQLVCVEDLLPPTGYVVLDGRAEGNVCLVLLHCVR